MKNKLEKPSPEAKALSLFLMAHKSKSSDFKDKSNHIKRLWNMVLNGEISSNMYMGEVQNMLKSYGGYSEVVEKTVKFYIDKTGEWSLKGDDKYCVDAQKIADDILNS